MTVSRRKFLGGAALGGAALAMSGDYVLADTPLGQLPGVKVATDKLPGKHELYALRDGMGEYYLFGGQVATLLAGPNETDGEFVAATITGSMDSGLPIHVHAETDEVLYVMNGRLELFLDGKTYLMTPGDYAFVPAGTEHGYRMKSWRTRFLTWSLGDKLGDFYQSVGEPFSRPVNPENPDLSLSKDVLHAAEGKADVKFLREMPQDAEYTLVTTDGIPTTKQPYVVQEAQGERLVAADQMFEFLQTGENSDGTFFSVMTEGPAGPAIPWHYHQHHTENFFCLDGLMTMWVNGEEIKIYPGDYIQIPPNTVHSYRLDAPYTRFFGWLVPAVFEPFFRTIGDPYDAHTFPLVPPQFRFDRVMAKIDELDLHVVAVND